MQKIKVFLLIFIITLVNNVNIFADTDTKIFTDQVANVYDGFKDAKTKIATLKFTDINNHWGKEAIIKAGAFDMVKGYDKKYKPNDTVSNQEALAFVLRAIGLEKDAQEEGELIKNQAFGDSVLNIWSTGYLSLAKNIGLIDNTQYAQAITKDQSTLQAGDFKRDTPVSREQVASWLILAINSISAEPLSYQKLQYIYKYSDWKNISSSHINGVELALSNGIMNGLKNGKFNPKGNITRAEMAQVLTNLDEIYNSIFGYTKKTGTVGGIKDTQLNENSKSTLERNIYIRTSDGKIDILRYEFSSPQYPQTVTKDSVVYNSSSVTGLDSIREGDKIEYIIDEDSKEIKFVSVKNSTITAKDVFGKLSDVDYYMGTVKITDSKGKDFIYYVADGFVGIDDSGNFLFVNDKKIIGKNIPIGESVTLKTKNNIVYKIEYVGTPTLVKETRGIVLENNPDFSYLTILDNNGKEVTKKYFSDDIQVQKQKHYATQDNIGYLNQMFPNFKYDPRTSKIDKIEPGDIVFIVSKDDDNEQIAKISASPNYIMRYGKIMDISKNANYSDVNVKLQNGQNVSYNISNKIFISKNGKPGSLADLTNGSWVKLLVNEAILSPGETVESVKEIVIEESGHNISEIIKGEIGKLDLIQGELSISNSYSLKKSGWENLKQVRKLSINNSDAEYFYNDQQLDLETFSRYFKRANGYAYVAIEETYSGNVISKITFRNGRDETLKPDIITNANTTGTISLASYGILETDNGTIIRKDGKLINPSGISVNDYAVVSLNGNGKAAVIDIYETPVNDVISVARGRVSYIEEGRSFTVDSMSKLTGNDWIYYPSTRKFIIDSNTLFISNNGLEPIEKFNGVGSDTKVGKAFTIIYTGDKVSHIVDMPFSTRAVSGTIYENTSTNLILKDGKFVNTKGKWETVGIRDSSIKAKYDKNTIVIKGNKVISYNDLQKGDLVRIITEKLPEKITGGLEITARLIFVGN